MNYNHAAFWSASPSQEESRDKMGAMKGENDLNVSVQAGQHFTTFKCYSVVNLYAYFLYLKWELWEKLTY